MLLLLGAAALAVSPRYPFWRLRLLAPQYPRGLTVVGYPDRMTGDIHEIDGLNHYIGMRKLEQAAVRERQAAKSVIAGLAACMVVVALLPWRWPVLLLVPVIVFPLLFLGDLWWWLRDSGLNLDPKAPFSSSVKPFVPRMLGEGKIAQFRTHGALGSGFYLCSAAALASLLFTWVKLAPATSASQPSLPRGKREREFDGRRLPRPLLHSGRPGAVGHSCRHAARRAECSRLGSGKGRAR